MFMVWPEHSTKHMAFNQLPMLVRNLRQPALVKLLQSIKWKVLTMIPDSLRR